MEETVLVFLYVGVCLQKQSERACGATPGHLNIAGFRVLLCELSRVFAVFGGNPTFKIPQASGA